jgi:hypothetical protein
VWKDVFSMMTALSWNLFYKSFRTEYRQRSALSDIVLNQVRMSMRPAGNRLTGQTVSICTDLLALDGRGLRGEGAIIN